MMVDVNKEMPPKAPLWISPLYQHGNNTDNGSYRTVKRLVTKTPNPLCSDTARGEIETCLEEYLGPTREVLWRRVAVRGCIGAERVLHASFVLPEHDYVTTLSGDNGREDSNAVEDNNVMCWTSFPGRPGHQVLCVLASPLLLCIWDVYPLNGDETSESIGGGEGNALSLPFLARGIFPLADNKGLLLQRKQTLEDRVLIAIDEKRSSWVERGDLDDDFDGFVLQDPPTPVRLGTMLKSPSGMEMTITQPSPQASAAATMVPLPSLFSLKHPLDEILPVPMLEGDGSSASFPDILEQILFVGALRWAERDDDPYNMTEHTQSICVTHHRQFKRHAVWLINTAPPPTPTPPLWQVSRNQRGENGFDDDIGAMHEMDGNLGRIGVSDTDMSWHGTMNRNEALADALGVSTRKPDDPVTSRGRVVERSRRSGGLKKTPASIFSPLPNAKDVTMHSTGHEAKTTNQFPVDNSGTTPDKKAVQIAESPFADLSPDFALTLLHEDEPDTADRAAINIFLASNVEASGSLVLCLVCPVKNDLNPNELRWLSFGSSRSQQLSAPLSGNHCHSFSVKTTGTTPCLSAQPVQATPVPLCFAASDRKKDAKEALATDVLVLTRTVSNGDNRLVLCRSGIFLADCALPAVFDQDAAHVSSHASTVIAMVNAVGDCVDYVCSDTTGATTSVRGRICLLFPSSPISNAALEASDAAFFLSNENEPLTRAVETALHLRVAAVRLAQALSGQCCADNFQDEGTSWTAVQCVLSSFIESLLGTFAEPPNLTSSDKDPSMDEDWLALLNSDYHEAYKSVVGTSLLLGSDDCDGSYESIGTDAFKVLSRTVQPSWLMGSSDFLTSISDSLPKTPLLEFRVFDSLHLLYEESKLSLYRSWRKLIGSLLARICFRSGYAAGNVDKSANFMSDFLDHYRRDLGTKWLEDIEKESRSSYKFVPLSLNVDSYRQSLTSFLAPPSFLEWVDSMMKTSSQRDGIPSDSFYNIHQSAKIPFVFRKTRALHRVFSVLYGEDAIASAQSISDDSVLHALIDEGINNANEVRDDFPAGLAVPLMEVLYRCREDPRICALASWSSDAWSLIGRTDMSKQRKRSAVHLSLCETTESFPAHGQHYQDLLADGDKDGIGPVEVTSSVLFTDNRLHEVGKLLRSSRPIFLQVQRAPEVSDHDYERLKQQRLLVLCRRTFAAPLGRGMLTLGNLKPIPADPLPVPLLCLSGRVPPTNTSLALDTTSSPADISVWPEFHNAVAAGLRLPYNEQTSEETLRQITRSWIVYNGSSGHASTQQNSSNSDSTESSSHVSHAQGGLLMALGLRGHLATLKMTDIYDYLTDGVVTTTVGVLLGMAANRKGSCDPAVSKMLCLHIPSLLPASFTGIDVASPAQAAAVTGIGLLYQGSSNRMMTEFLLEEMGKRPTNDSIMPDREAYTLSCGLALGMVNLAKGNDSSGAFDGVGWNGLADLDLGERLHRLIVGGIDHPEQQKRRKEAAERFSNNASTESERCYSIFEGDTVNTDVTAPGATLALGLMYMKSGNHAVASSMALPDTFFLLEYVRPDLLLLRVLSRALIFWNDVEPTADWIDDQIPSVVRESYQHMRSIADLGTNTMAENGEGVDPFDHSLTNPNVATSALHDEVVDKQAVRQIHVHVIAGACLGLGLRFAGTGDERAASAVSDRLAELKRLREGNDPVSAALRPELQILEMCIGCVAISLAMIMAGTGDLEIFRVLRTIRWRIDDDIGYGSHMAYASAIGLLFLGGGSYTLGRAPEDIAALVMAFFPRLPSTTSDNQHHLQALRHFYALAVEKRELRAVDSETGTIVSVPIEIDFTDESIPSKKVTAPCLLMNTNGTPKSLRISSDEYYPLSLDISKESFRNAGTTFFVKRRSGHSSHSEYCRAQRSLVVNANSARHTVRTLADVAAEDPMIIAFSQHLCDDPSRPLHGRRQRRLSWVPDFCARVLHECLSNDAKEALPLYLKLRSSVEAVRDDCPASVEAAWDVRLIRTYYERHSTNTGSTTRLLSAEFVSMLNELVEEALSSTPLDENDVLVYMKSGEVRRTVSADAAPGLLGSFVTFYDVPFPLRRAGTMV